MDQRVSMIMTAVRDIPKLRSFYEQGIGYREKRLTRAIPFALAAVFMGGAFSFAYLFVATLTARGDAQRLLLGDRAPVAA